MPSKIPASLLGRYEYVDATSNKFWSIEPGPEPGTYTARWGRIGTEGQGPKVYEGHEAQKKINEKISKGYVRVAGAHGMVVHKEVEREEVKSASGMDFMKELKKI